MDTRSPLAHAVIAIDGPSGSGKTSVAREVAIRLGMRFLGTGAMYRAATWWLLESGASLSSDDVPSLVSKMPLKMGLDPQHPTVRIDGVDVSEHLHTSAISTAVSTIATNLGVRRDLVDRQQAIAAQGGVVIEGRDITTVVAPDADVRILLTAREDVRLARRARELHGEANENALKETQDQVIRRDADDSTVADFHEAAAGVDLIDSSDMTFDETVTAVLELVRRRITDAPVASDEEMK